MRLLRDQIIEYIRDHGGAVAQLKLVGKFGAGVFGELESLRREGALEFTYGSDWRLT